MYWNHMDFPIYAPKSSKFMHRKGNLKQVRTQENIVKPQEWFLPGKCSHLEKVDGYKSLMRFRESVKTLGEGNFGIDKIFFFFFPPKEEKEKHS